jgi:hypothetical protein
MDHFHPGIASRLYRHLWAADREVRTAFPPRSLQGIEDAVAASERRHGGELRVVIEGGLGWDAWRQAAEDGYSRQRAVALFAQLGVWDTEENSGVLIYVLMAEHRLEIVADRGIHAKVGTSAWASIIEATTARFARGEYEAGLVAAIESVGMLLQEHFPAGQIKADELPNRPLVL